MTTKDFAATRSVVMFADGTEGASFACVDREDASRIHIDGGYADVDGARKLRDWLTFVLPEPQPRYGRGFKKFARATVSLDEILSQPGAVLYTADGRRIEVPLRQPPP